MLHPAGKGGGRPAVAMGDSCGISRRYSPPSIPRPHGEDAMSEPSGGHNPALRKQRGRESFPEEVYPETTPERFLPWVADHDLHVMPGAGGPKAKQRDPVAVH